MSREFSQRLVSKAASAVDVASSIGQLCCEKFNFRSRKRGVPGQLIQVPFRIGVDESIEQQEMPLGKIFGPFLP